MLKYIPGTVLEYDENSQVSPYNIIKPLFSFTNGITLAQVRELTGLETSTIQNWVKRGWVASPVNKRYKEQQVIRIILINSIRRAMQIEKVITLMTYINGDVEDTSDDIVSDGVLFDEFCKAVINCDKVGALEKGTISSVIGEQLRELSSVDETGKNKLQKTLHIMVTAYLASQLQDMAEEEYKKLFA